MKATVKSCAEFFLNGFLFLSVLTGVMAATNCTTNPDRPCQCRFKDGSVFDAGAISKNTLSVAVPLGDDAGEIYELRPCNSPKHFCEGEFGKVPNVSVCMEAVTTEPSVGKLIVGMVPNVSYTVINENPSNFTIVARYAPITKYEAKGSKVTYIYNASCSTPTIACANCPSDRGQFAPELVVQSDKVKTSP